MPGNLDKIASKNMNLIYRWLVSRSLRCTYSHFIYKTISTASYNNINVEAANNFTRRHTVKPKWFYQHLHAT